MHSRRRMAWLFLLLGLAYPAGAKAQAALYAGLIKSKGYVVGSPLAASGLHRFEGDTTWVHLGWNHPRINGISYDPANPDVLFLATGSGGFRSVDGGATWRVTTGWEVTEAQDVAVDPGAPEHVYLGTAYGVWRTADGGETWAEATSALQKKYTQTVEVDRTRAGRVFAGTEGGLYVSEDAGRSWTLAGGEGVMVLDVQQSVANPSVWLAGTEGRGVLVSRDGGRSWRFTEDDVASVSVYGVAIDPDDPARMAAVGWDTGVLLSTDGGQHWEQRGQRLPVPHGYEVIFDANRPGRLWVATVEAGVFHTDDDGRSWQSAGLYGTLVFDMIFIPQAR